MRSAGPDHPGVSQLQGGPEVPGRNQGQIRGRVLVTIGNIGLRAELVIGGVKVAREHARHQRPAGQVDHPIDLTGGTAGTNLGDAVAVEDNGGVLDRRPVAVEESGSGQGKSGHPWASDRISLGHGWCDVGVSVENVVGIIGRLGPGQLVTASGRLGAPGARMGRPSRCETASCGPSTRLRSSLPASLNRGRPLTAPD